MTTPTSPPLPTVKRLSVARLVEHHINAIAFFTLAFTGLAQKFHAQGWAQWLVATLGGIDNVRIIHRTTGVIFAALLVQHVLVAVYLMVFRHVRPGMIIKKRDFTDAIDNIRYYLGRSQHPARCDRYDYKQKFEYWGVLLGGTLMMCTGFVLWFPTVVLRWIHFLPGQIIPAAKVVHSNEAMMAFLIIVIWHIYNSVFSPEVFPFDSVFFKGRIPIERLRHEHALEYERLVAEGVISAPAEDSDTGAPPIGDSGPSPKDSSS